METLNSVELKALDSLQSYMKELRTKVCARRALEKSHEPVAAVSTDRRVGFLNGRAVNRLVVFMKGTGCSQVKKTGGCTCCGFFSISNLGVKIDDDFYRKEIHKIIDDSENKIDDFEIACLYNDGSLLNEEEFSFEVLIYMIQQLNKISSIKRMVIESKVNDITEEKLKRIRENTNKEFEITIGYESSSEKVRQLCVNRPFYNKDFEEKVKIAQQYNISIVPLLMVKSAFLSEYEAIEDYVSSLVYLEQFGLERIDMELPTVMKDTLNYDLWVNGMYKPIKFWSVIEILKQRQAKDLKTKLYISPMIYSVAAVDKAGNCDSCSDTVYQMFDKFNKTGDISIFDSIECECKKEYEESLERVSDIENLGSRIIQILGNLRKANLKLEADTQKV